MAMAAVVAFALVGCEDDLVKDDIDAKYKSNRSVTLSAPVCTDITYDSVKISYQAEFDDLLFTVLQKRGYDSTFNGEVYDTVAMAPRYGVVVSKSKDLFDSTIVDVAVDPGVDIKISLAGGFTYYAKSYFVVGNEIQFSEATIFSMPAPPEFEDKYLFGKYQAYDDGNDSYIYEMEISWVKGTYNKIEIHNWWDGGETVSATVDFETKEIIVDDEPLVYSGDDGEFVFYGVNEDESANPNPVGLYDDEGNISFPYYYIALDGEFVGAGCTDMIKEKKSENNQ